jgi:hypothetical protein
VHSQSADNIVYELNNLALNISSSIYDNYYRLPINPTLNNVLTARTSPQYLDVDYGYDSILPVNLNYLTASLKSSLNSRGFEFLNAPVQDSNYTLKRHINPRYNGSRLFSNLYNIYSPGDISYGNSPVIDLNPIKFAYFREITSQSLTFPGRVNVNTKYLIDSASSVIELTEANKNLFDVQSIFSKSNVNVALDNVNQPTKQKALNGLKSIYAGGFRYEPILQNASTITSNWSSIEFSFLDDIPITNPASGSLITASLGNSLIVNSVYLKNRITTAPQNVDLETLTVTLNSPITFDVTRNTSANVTLRQRVTGSVKLTIPISPASSGAPVELYEYRYFTGSPVELQAGNYNPRQLPFQGNVVNWVDRIISYKVPAGKKLWMGDNSTGNQILVTGPTSGSGDGSNAVSQRPLVYDKYGIDDYWPQNQRYGVRVFELDCEVAFTPSSIQNTFQTSAPLVSLNLGSGQYSLEEENGLIIEATYPFEGEIVLNQNDTVGQIDLLIMNSSAVGNLQGIFNFATTPGSTKIKHTTLPSYNIISQYKTPYYYTQAPNIIYINKTNDNGFSSGSQSNSNWYFERGDKVVSGSVFTILTASYDLSKLYYDHYIPGAPNYGNYLKQIIPSQSLELGYQDITENFNPKKGDLIRFYNIDSNKFPFSQIFEREIINIYPPSQPPLIGTGVNGTGSYAGRLAFEVSELNTPRSNPDIPAQACTNNPTGSTIGKVLNFIMLTKIPDETNVILIADKRPGQTSPGILLPEFLDKQTKEDAGNIVKRLKSQNLLDIFTSNNN